MERIAAGQPPIIFGDGTPDDGLRLRRGHRARQHPRREVRRRPTTSSTSPAAPRRSLQRAAPSCCCASMGSSARARVRARRARSTPCRGASPTRSRRSRMLGFESRVVARRGPARAGRLVAARSETAWRMTARHRRRRPMIPIAKPVARRGGARGGAPAAPLGLGHAGAGGRGVRARVRRVRRRAARLRGLELHDRAAPGAARRRRRAGRRGHHRQPLVHRHRQRDPLLRRDAGLRRHRAATPTTSTRRASRRRSRRGPRRSCACTRSGMPCDLAGDRRDRAGATGCRSSRTPPAPIGSEILWNGAWERIGRPHGDIACFSFHPRKVITHRRRRHAHDRQPASGTAQFRLLRQHGMSVPDTVAARRRREVVFEEYPSSASTTG